jgi:hypothetical protein
VQYDGDPAYHYTKYKINILILETKNLEEVYFKDIQDTNKNNTSA